MTKRTHRIVGAMLGLSIAAAPAAYALDEHTTAHGPAIEPGGAAVSGEHGVAAEHGAQAGHDEHDAPGPINWLNFGNKEQPPYAALLINFALLLGLYFYFGKGPIGEGLKKRRDEISKEIDEAEKIKREAQQRAHFYQAKLERLDEELVGARQSLIGAGKGEREAIVRDAEEKAVRLRRDAGFLIEQEQRQMSLDLQREAVNIAIAEAEELLRKRVTAADQERLAEEYLADLVAQTRSLPGGAS